MERSFYRRGRRVIVEEIPGVRAVQLRINERGAPAADLESLGTPARESVRSFLSDELLRAFENAHWRFVRPDAESLQRIDSGESPLGAEDAGKLLRRTDGSVVIATHRLNVQLQPELSENECTQILAEKRLDIIRKLRFAQNLYEVDARGREDALAASVELHDDPRFSLAEPSLIEHVPPRYRPTDPYYVDQWQWNNNGQNGGTVGADVRAEEAWNTTRGAGIRVAVIDNGFDVNHEDLAAGVSAMSGYFTSSGDFIQSTTGMLNSNHGTFCAGIVGARHNNSRGGCGAAPEAELILIAALGDQVGTQTTLARAVAYASDPTTEVSTASAANGADILVCSLGPNDPSWELSATLGWHSKRRQGMGAVDGDLRSSGLQVMRATLM